MEVVHDKTKWNCLHFAVANCEIVEYLSTLSFIEKIVNGPSEKYLHTPLMVAVYNEQAESVKALLGTKGIDVEAKDISGNSALQIAIFKSNDECIKLILEATSNDYIFFDTYLIFL